jgi:hypothetical protein
MCSPLLAQNTPYPRIVNLYGAGLAWKSIDVGLPYWKKLGMIVGGGSDWHYDYDSTTTIAAHERARANAEILRKADPRIVILPYFDVIEGPYNPALPKNFWLYDTSGAKVSTWPGYYRVDTKNPSVLDMTKAAVLKRAFTEKVWDGSFLDCWEPDSYLVPSLRAAGPDQIIITNIGHLPREVSPLANGAMSEDELNLVTEGRLDFEDLMDRYQRWCRDSAKPALSIISCYPRTIDPDPWKWAKKSATERRRIIDAGRTDDMAMMRFGLSFTLMGEGFFAYDAGTQQRGTDWWYPEYDAPLGAASGPAREVLKDVWTRDFEGGVVYVNGSLYDEEILFKNNMKDISTGRIAKSFILPSFDGRIFIPTSENENSIPSDPLRFSRTASNSIRTENKKDGSARWQIPGGLELFFSAEGLLNRIAWKGETLFKGGSPNIVLKEWRTITSRKLSSTFPSSLNKSSTFFVWSGRNAWSTTTGTDGDFLVDDWKISVTQEPDGVTIFIEDNFNTLDNFELSMWRHYLFLPVAEWKGVKAVLRDNAQSAPRTVILPVKLGESDLGWGKTLELERDTVSVRVTSSIDFSLVDHRKWNTQDYLWAGYPMSGTVHKGRKIDVSMTIKITEARDGQTTNTNLGQTKLSGE